jgi:hypothetical protein
VADIKKIPVGRAERQDWLAWNFTKNGIFSVRSAYHLKMQQKKLRVDAAELSTTVDSHRGWLALWSANVPGKV